MTAIAPALLANKIRPQFLLSQIMPLWLNMGLAGVLLALVMISLALGPVSLSWHQMLRGLLGHGDLSATLIMRENRLARVLLGLMVGSALGLSGAALQGLLRNPLADPAVIGISSGAAAGSVLAFYTGIAAIVPLALPIGGMLGALIAMALLYGLIGRQASVLTVILAGVAIASLGNAMTALLLNISPNPYAASEIVFWLLGSLTDRSLTHVWLAGPPIIIGICLLASVGRGLDALTIGEAGAISLGHPGKITTRRVILGTSLAVGAAVAVSGGIGFIGLIVPHLLRPWVGYRPSRLLLPSALTGAALLLVSDLIVRVVPLAGELKLGVITALIGAPFFLILLSRQRRMIAL